MKTQTIRATIFQMMLFIFLSTTLAGADGSAGGAAVYLREGLGARVMGMGNAGTAASRNADAAYWNPAILAELRGSRIASQTSLLGMGRSWDFINFCYSFAADGNRMGLGLSWISFSAGDIEVRSINQLMPERKFSDREQAFMLSGACELVENLSLGVNAKLLNHHMDNSEGKGAGFDLSLWNAASDAFRWGMMVQDIYSSLRWSSAYAESIPTVWRMGAEYVLADDIFRLAGDIAVEYSTQYRAVRSVGYHLGAEYILMEGLALRVGWDTDRLTAGAGLILIVIKSTPIWLDYALAGERLPGSGTTHLFSLMVDM